MPDEKYVELEARLTQLEKQFAKLKEWSDLNDYWLRELIDNLAFTVDKLLGIDHEGEY